MLSKDKLFEQHSQNYKPLFLLAWSHMLTYSELKKADMLEAYLALKDAGIVKSQKDWDATVVPYTEDNVKKMLCIEINKANRALPNLDSNMEYMQPGVCAHDLTAWLYILEDSDAKTFEDSYKMERQDLLEYKNEISKKYKFEL